jgi:dTDP-4-dehydrorhamnose reductase
VTARTLVLGSTGMLGSAVFTELEKAGLNTISASRTSGVNFDATTLLVDELFSNAGLSSGDYVVNCVGLTKSRIDESSLRSRALAVRLNIDFPDALATAAQRAGVKVIQVATDCVYSGLKGAYSESDKHDPFDVYGKTKSLGEVPSDNVMHLRCSLIGPEIGRSSLFFEWVRQQPEGSKVTGFTNHLWNGLSSDAFGRIVSGIVRSGSFRAGVQHLVPADVQTKDQLVRTVLNELSRSDVQVESGLSDHPIDRTLSTDNTEFNAQLFRMAGYEQLPTIRQMVHETCAQLAN